MISSPEEFIRLRSSDDPTEYRRAVEDGAPESVWLHIIELYPTQRRNVALNRKLPESVQWRLVRDESPLVRFEIAMRRQLTAEMLEVLANDPDETVRTRVCYNAHTPRKVLQRLARDGSTLVAEAAIDRIKMLGDEADSF